MTDYPPTAGGPPAHDPYGVPPTVWYPVTPQPPGPPTDPLISSDYAGWWNRGVSIVRRGWRPLAALQVVGLIVTLGVQAPVAVYLALASQRLSQTFAARDPGQATDLSPLLGLLGITAMSVLLGIILTSLVTLATVHVGVSVATGAPARLSDALALAVRRVFPLIGWQLAAIPIYLVALCACVLPVLYVAGVFTVLPVVVAVERRNAIGRCFSLFNRDLGVSIGRIATIFGLGIASAVVSAVLGSVIRAASGIATSGQSAVVAGSAVSAILGALIGGVVAILVAPLTLAAYADMRARVEPVDTARIAWELGIAPPPPQPGFTYG